MSFQHGLSGLNVAAKNLDAVGNNIANASTIGYKSARAEFADVFASAVGAAASNQIGIGATVAAVRQQFSQGNITSTQNPLDVAINGAGFFRLSTDGAISYSRNGQFSLDKNGYIVSNGGARLTGYPADASGNVLRSTPVELQMSFADLAPQPTTDVRLSLNLDSRVTAPTAAFDMNDPSTYNSQTAMTVFDSQGNAHALTLYFRKTAANAWEVHGALDGTVVGSGPLGTMSFSGSGALSADTVLNLSVDPGNGADTLDFDVTFASDKVTQFGVDFAVSYLQQDGYSSGRLVGFAIGADGTVLGRYTNGQTRAQGQIALANFINPNGLAPQGGNQWVETADSGQPLIGPPGNDRLGTLQSGALEESNVDLTEELVKMITAQRIYQANAQTVRTQDQIMQTLVNLR
jgi:flagellar hook protein FlgE